MSKKYLESVNSGDESVTNAYELRESEILPLSIATHEAHSPVDHDPLSIKEQVDGSYKLTSAFKIFSKLTQDNTSILGVDDPPKKKHDHGEEESVNNLALEWYESSGKANINDSLVQASSTGSTLTQHSQVSVTNLLLVVTVGIVSFISRLWVCFQISLQSIGAWFIDIFCFPFFFEMRNSSWFKIF
jgi:hypothetical protein